MILLAAVNLAQANIDDISLRAMSDWAGEPYTDVAGRQKAYKSLVKELGSAIGSPSVKIQSLGIFGAEIRLENRFSFIDTERSLDNSPSPWALATPDEDPNLILWSPELQIRKGLPLSTEVGVRFGSLYNTKQGTVGVWFRCAPIEGYANVPDISIRWGYTSLTGSEELGLQTSDLGIAIGKSLPFGPLKGANSSQFSPHLSLGLMSITATPRLSADDTTELGLFAISPNASSDDYQSGFSPFYASAGLEVSSQDFSASLNYRYVMGALSTMSFSVGWRH